jgi:hypothetical protein
LALRCSRRFAPLRSSADKNPRTPELNGPARRRNTGIKKGGNLHHLFAKELR